MSNSIIEYLAQADIYYLLFHEAMSRNQEVPLGKQSPIYSVKISKGKIADFDYTDYLGVERNDFNPTLASLVREEDLPDLILVQSRPVYHFNKDGLLHGPNGGGQSNPSLVIRSMILLWGTVMLGVTATMARIKSVRPRGVGSDTNRYIQVRRADSPAIVRMDHIKFWHDNAEIQWINCGKMMCHWVHKEKLLRSNGGPHTTLLEDIRILPQESNESGLILNDHTVNIGITDYTWNTMGGKNISEKTVQKVLNEKNVRYEELSKDRFFQSKQEFMIFLQGMQAELGQ